MERAFLPLEAVVGGLFIGCATGVYMVVAGRIAGSSGALKALIVGPREPTKLSFLAGLCGGGVLGASLLPSSFEILPSPSPLVALAGLLVGLGTALANGCTSGHGLCGLSRLSLRSLVAVPTFMAAAIATATARSGSDLGLAPIGTTSPEVLALAAKVRPPSPLSPLPLQQQMSPFHASLGFILSVAVGRCHVRHRASDGSYDRAQSERHLLRAMERRVLRARPDNRRYGAPERSRWRAFSCTLRWHSVGSVHDRSRHHLCFLPRR